MINRRTDADIVVVGGAVVGAAAALSLARQGLRVALVESAPARGWSAAAEADLRVFALSPASVALFEGLGLWTAVQRARAQPYRHMEVWDAAGGDPLRFDASDVAQPALGWIAEQSLLQHVLWQAVLAEPRIDCHCPDTVTGLEQDEDSVVLSLSSGGRLRAGFALAADGADSPLRGFAGIDAPRHDYRQRGVVCFASTGLPHAQTAWQRFLPGGPLAFLPFADGRSSIVWTVADDEAARLLSLDDATFAAELERAFDGRLGAIQAVSRRASFPLRRQVATRFLQGRVLLAGDAAHVVHPLAGQGVNLGLQDVAMLSACWQAAATQSPVGSASPAALLRHLQRYARARRSDALLAAHAFEAINRGFSNDALLPTLLRGPALGLVGRVAPLRRFFIGHAAGWT